MEKKSNVFKIILIVLVVVVAAFGGYFYGKNYGVERKILSKIVSDYLNQSEARKLENFGSCGGIVGRNGLSKIDVGGKYHGVWDGSAIVGVCQ
ncbi:MAG: hypothetical protein KatS3mg098_038 [Candidatus Parcubacteria bacterium]|nr:MAG: hypothetical protein KatS3mg098_038 [Candidatus Parcubacteria bacterium]